MPTIQTNCSMQLLLCLAIATASQAQPNAADTSHSLAGTRAAIFYQSYIGVDAALYNGFAYQPNYRGVQGSPYFETANLTDGSLTFEGLTYTHIPLLYDLVLDQLIIADPKGQLLIPTTDKVQQFIFSGRTFMRLTVKHTTSYFELLLPGDTTLLVRHTKKLEEKIELGQLQRYITDRDDYYLLKEGQYYPVRRRDRQVKKYLKHLSK